MTNLDPAAADDARVTSRRGWSGAVIVVATLAAVLPWGRSGVAAQLAAGAVLAVLSLSGWLLRDAPVIRVLVFLDVVWIVFIIGGSGSSAWVSLVATVVVCLAPLLSLLCCNRVPWLRPAAPWLRRGRVSAGLIAFGLVTVVAAGTALTMWARFTRPDPSPYLESVQRLPLWLGILGVLGFALVNPIWEEALFRGVVLQELMASWGAVPAVIVQAALFGAAHWAGFPSGWIGMAMAAGWGAALGVIRVRSGGIGLGYGVHVCANAVIGTLALVLLA